MSPARPCHCVHCREGLPSMCMVAGPARTPGFVKWVFALAQPAEIEHVELTSSSHRIPRVVYQVNGSCGEFTGWEGA